ncbi:uncharacterized protein [Arachis hypogaea]|uniref:uncharacterized protein n=1 Tax=Arachis hypogaea TaxID=3818 RepID=UPI000DEC4355
MELCGCCASENGIWPKVEGVGEGVCYYGYYGSPGKRATIQVIQDGAGAKTRGPTVSSFVRASCRHDTILFCPPETETIVNYKRLLWCFELMSGLSINFDKSNLISVNCEQGWIDQACRLLGCQQAALSIRYLGISLGANPRLVRTWKPIIEKVEQKLSLWKAKVLNKAGKLVLIKLVLNSLPIYYLSLYKMPKAVADRIIALQRNFMWCKEDGTSGIPLVKWELVQAPKKAGGLGVGDAVLRNTALLFKWWW